MRRYSKLAATAIACAALFALAEPANAGTCTLQDEPTGYRTATLTDSDPCYGQANVTGTPKAADVAFWFDGTWVEAGTLSGSNGTNKYFTVTASNWGTNVTGTWAIDPEFWNVYGSAVITMHVGNGGPVPAYDWFFFGLEDGATSGTFTYKRNSGGGGGLSNLFLWGSGTPTRVPEPATLGLLGLGLAGLGLRFRRRRS